MKTTQRILVGWMAVAMSISAGFARAGLADRMAAALLASAAVGQQAGSGTIFPGFSSNGTRAPNDPFAARGVTAAGRAVPAANGVTRLPPHGRSTAVRRRSLCGSREVRPRPKARRRPATIRFKTVSLRGTRRSTPRSDKRAARTRLLAAIARIHSDDLLRQARLALAVGDTRRAADPGRPGSARRRFATRPMKTAPSASRRPSPGSWKSTASTAPREENRRAYARMLDGAGQGLVAVGRVGAGRHGWPAWPPTSM